MNTTIESSETQEACPITEFVIALGKLLLQEKVRDWVDMEGLARFVKEQGIELDGKCPLTSELETRLREFFKSKDEFYAPGINVDGYERPNGWDRPFMIRAFPYDPAQQSNYANYAELDALGAVAGCND